LYADCHLTSPSLSHPVLCLVLVYLYVFPPQCAKFFSN